MDTDNPSGRVDTQATQADEVLHQEIVYRSLTACAGWAYTEMACTLDVLLWPHSRGPMQEQLVPYRVTSEVVKRGVWRITLRPAHQLPGGVFPATRDAAVRTQLAMNALQLDDSAVDQVIQCGLFGEVLYGV